MPSVTHEVDQVLEVDLSQLSEEDRNAVIECHKKPDAYKSDDSFPGEMTCRIDDCIVEESSESPGSFTLKRTLYFDFTWDDEDEMSEWGGKIMPQLMMQRYQAMLLEITKESS